jgi:hypothetical protein
LTGFPPPLIWLLGGYWQVLFKGFFSTRFSSSWSREPVKLILFTQSLETPRRFLSTFQRAEQRRRRSSL